MFNLLEVLPTEDKEKIAKYINKYGVKENFIGVDAWLQHWAKDKIKLYKLLNNQFIYKIPFEYKKNEAELYNQMYSLIDKHDFVQNFLDWTWYCRRELNEYKENSSSKIVNLFKADVFVSNQIDYSFKFIMPNKKELQIQKGMKPIKAISKVLKYFSPLIKESKNDENDFAKTFEQQFEDFRIKHSLILNDNQVKGDMVFSIHPLDFLTMSDNNSDWISCMSWKDGGCYHVGTIEMMNSNNVICCYLESKEPYFFDNNQQWSNKKWRQLFYVTKDIIVSGKPYPYHNNDITKHFLQVLRDLAKNNLNWNYNFGIEQYLDMKHITGMYSMNRARTWIATNQAWKHNILFDSKGMYNDMLNDQDTRYWCIRNKVNHTKIISYSGKANCLCCGEEIIVKEYDDVVEEYNDRYLNTGSSICEPCKDKFFKCKECGYVNPLEKHKVYINSRGEKEILCEHCWTHNIKLCPDCGEPMVIPSRTQDMRILLRYEEEVSEIDVKKPRSRTDFLTAEPIYGHKKCIEKKFGVLTPKRFNIDSYWYVEPYDTLLTPIVDKKDREQYSDFFYQNLKPYDSTDENHPPIIKSMIE